MAIPKSYKFNGYIVCLRGVLSTPRVASRLIHFLQAVVVLIDKQGHGAILTKHFDQAQTPYQCILESSLSLTKQNNNFSSKPISLK